MPFPFRHSFTFVAVLLSCSACATAPPEWMARAGPLPSDEQVAAFVQANWAESYDYRFGRRLRVQSDATLVSVADVKCRYRHRVPDCTFTAEGRLVSGATLSTRMQSSFEWQDDGSLEEIVIIIGG